MSAGAWERCESILRTIDLARMDTHLIACERLPASFAQVTSAASAIREMVERRVW